MSSEVGATRPLFIGEAPSRSTARLGGAPLVGESGRRLAAWAGLSPAQFRERATLVNLFDGYVPAKWEAAAARRVAQRMWANMMQDKDHVLGTFGWWSEALAAPSVVVLLGEKVAAAFGVNAAARWTVFQTAGPPMAVMPHPSGLNHYWNDPSNVRRAERFLRRLLGVRARRPRQPRLPMMTATVKGDGR